ncbi:MAG: DUF3180 domain-containing protein [Rhodococcus sp. (in: high G+C Gram-positive bacteria)]
MKATRIRDLAGLCVVAAVAAWLLVRSFYGSLPPISVVAGASLYPVALGEVVLGFYVRARIADRRVGDGPHQLHPITAARALALAKASALVGAAVTGVWIGFLLHIAPMASTVRAASEDRAGAVVGLIAGIALVASAVWLEQCCRAPKDNHEA